MLPSDGRARPDALIKTKLVDGDHSAYMWLNRTATQGDNFTAELFEVPDNLPNFTLGHRYVVTSKNCWTGWLTKTVASLVDSLYGILAAE